MYLIIILLLVLFLIFACRKAVESFSDYLYEKYAIPTKIEEHEGKICQRQILAAEGAEQCDKISDYHIAELPKYCGNCKTRHISYEHLKHFFKIYVNNFPGAKELRAKLMETHSVPEARDIINL